MRKLFLSALFATVVGLGTVQAADIVVKLAPPKIRVEHRSARPGPEYVWQSGYHRWDGHAYVWESGRWEKAPHARAVWVAPRWNHTREGYVFVEGHWR